MTKLSDLEYKEIMGAEMSPDLYDGEGCDQVRPRWWAYAEGDMEGDYEEVLTLNAKDFPAGARVVVSIPCCPKCHQDVEMCKEDEYCDFDWDTLVLNEYA